MGHQRADLDQAQEAIGLKLCAGENHIQIICADGFGNSFAEDLAEVRGDGEIAAFVELLVCKAGPATVNLASLHLAAKYKHGVGVTVVGAAGSVLARGAAEF